MRDLMRRVRLPTGHVLEMFYTGQMLDPYHERVAYELCGPDGETIFEGDDYGPGQGAGGSSDDDESVEGLLSFLALRPGDTDPEWFESYTPEQLAFAEEFGELISLYASEHEWENCDDD